MEPKVETQKVIDLNELKPIEGGELVDLDGFDKKEVEIEKAEVINVKSDFTESKTQWVLKVSSVPVASIGEGDNKINFRASELFNLIQDKQGNLLGYPESEGANLYKFMKDMRVSKPSELIGKKALVKAFEKNNRTFLKFRY